MSVLDLSQRGMEILKFDYLVVWKWNKLVKKVEE